MAERVDLFHVQDRSADNLGFWIFMRAAPDPESGNRRDIVIQARLEKESAVDQVKHLNKATRYWVDSDTGSYICKCASCTERRAKGNGDG